MKARSSRRTHNFQIWKIPSSGEQLMLRDNTGDTTPYVEDFEFVTQFRTVGFLEAHVAHFGELPQIDRKIRPLVLLLNELGYMTEYSCSGHEGRPVDREGYIALFADSAQSARKLIGALSSIKAQWIDEHETWPPVCVTVEVSTSNWKSLAHDDEWPLRLGFAPATSRPITAANYAWLGKQLLEKLALPGRERARLRRKYFG